MTSIALDPGKIVNIYLRQNRAGSFKLVFKNPDDSPFDISAIPFILNVKRWKDGPDVISLSIGSGLTVGGAGSNELTVTLTEAQTDISPLTYFWQLVNDTIKKTWLNGDFIIHNGKFDSFTNNAGLTISTDSGTIEITITDASGGSDVDGGTP